ncbi:O-antigen ligase family protein [Geothrix mesophila]|uniref:O-antigen ligase family protein n=1 Tax=Geothrix mesophila TaxID=2922723 RepID=UPI001FAE0AA5|nr:O-antigen ligase family protein [Geothrix sp. SG198]
MTERRATGLPEPGPTRSWATELLQDGDGQNYELRGTWAFVTWGTMATIALVPFTNVFVPMTNRQYSMMSVTQLFFWVCLLLSPRVLKRGFSPVLVWLGVLFGIRYVYGSLLSTLPAQMTDSTRNMIRPMLWAWILAAVMRDDQLRKRACDVFVLGCTLAGTLHLMGIGIGAPIVEALGEQRVSAFELNPNVLGVIYATGFVIAIARVIQPRTGYGWVARLLFLGAGIIMILGLLLTGSRTAAIFAAIGVVTVVAIETRRARWSLPAVLVSMIFMGLVVGGGLAKSIIEKRSEHVVNADISGEDRARMAPVLIEQFLRSPLYGLGPENYRVELGHRSRTGDSDAGIVAHNQMAMFAVEMGLFGLIPFLIICGLLLSQAWRVRAMEGGLPFALALPCVITACTTANIAFHWHFYFIAGLVAGAYGAHRRLQTSLQTSTAMEDEP